MPGRAAHLRLVVDLSDDDRDKDPDNDGEDNDHASAGRQGQRCLRSLCQRKRPWGSSGRACSPCGHQRSARSQRPDSSAFSLHPSLRALTSGRSRGSNLRLQSGIRTSTAEGWQSWTNAHDSKSCVPQGTGGSNPSPSANLSFCDFRRFCSVPTPHSGVADTYLLVSSSPSKIILPSPKGSLLTDRGSRPL